MVDMEIAMLLFDKLAPLDAVGPFEVMRNVPGWVVRTVAKEKGEVRSRRRRPRPPRRPHPRRGDLAGCRPRARRCRQPAAAARTRRCCSWLREVDRTTKWTTSVCTGSLVLGAAGLLEGKRATSNWLLLDALREYGADPVGGRFVEDGKIVTAAGVTAGIDMALHLVAQEAGPEVAQAVQLGIEYDPDPPFDSGSPEKAAPEIVELVRTVAAANDPLLAARD